MFGLEHLGNCHGEWNSLLALIAMAPFLGPWLVSKFKRRKSCCDGHDHNEVHP